MSEEQSGIARAYKRAGAGLAVAALLWTLALLFAGQGDEKSHWLIPICAAALSVLCFSLYAKSKEQ